MTNTEYADRLKDITDRAMARLAAAYVDDPENDLDDMPLGPLDHKHRGYDS